MVALHLFHIIYWFLKVPSFNWFLWKIMPKIPYLKAFVIIRALFKKGILNLSVCLKGWKFDRICILCYPFGLVFCPSPFNTYFFLLAELACKHRLSVRPYVSPYQKFYTYKYRDMKCGRNCLNHAAQPLVLNIAQHFMNQAPLISFNISYLGYY